jgi:acyl-CoA synthetase (NDP forming)
MAGKEILNSFGVSVPRSQFVAFEDAGPIALDGLSPPYVVKVVSPDIIHKSDVGGVAVGLADGSAVSQAIDEMSRDSRMASADVQGYLIEEMVGAGVEMVVGAVCDPHFGQMVMVGLGGIFVEVLEDVTFRICPISENDAHEMLSELQGAPMLDGVRGRAAVSRDAIVDVMLRIAGKDGLLSTFENEIAEFDLNPLIVTTDGAVAADAQFILKSTTGDETEAPASIPPRHDLPVIERFDPLFNPKTVAVVGASSTGVTMANTFIRRMKEFGYPGEIFPIHPKATEVEGLQAFPSLAEAPQVIDYAYIAIGAEHIPDLLADTDGRVRFAQVISSGFGELEGGRQRQHELIAKAHGAGIRVLGPNCLGTYSPRGGVTFPEDAPKDLGTVGIVSQSGGLSTDIIKRGQSRGLRYSGLVTVGNSADIGPVDLLEFYLEDPATKVVGMYLEGIEDGRALFDLLHGPRATKPVVILRGGRSAQGQDAAASHTGALAGDARAWQALTMQAPVLQVGTIDSFIDALLALQFLRLRVDTPTQRIVLFGNGGGTSVLATDYFADLGLDVAPFSEPTQAEMAKLDLPPGNSLANPIDTPVRTLQQEEGRIAGTILDIVYRREDPDALLFHLNLSSFVGRGSADSVGNLIQAALAVRASHQGQSHLAVALRTDGSEELEAEKRRYRTLFQDAGIPVFDEIPQAADALAAVKHLETRLAAK